MPTITDEMFYQDMPCGCCKSRGEHETKQQKRNEEESKIKELLERTIQSMEKKGYTTYEISLALQTIRDADRLKK